MSRISNILITKLYKRESDSQAEMLIVELATQWGPHLPQPEEKISFQKKTSFLQPLAVMGGGIG